jgi:hypothetical protein
MRVHSAKWRSRQCTLGSAILALATLGIFLVRAAERWLPLLPACLFHKLTGMPCLACGATRATLAFARGHWLAALQWHPLVVLIYVAVIAIGVLMILFAAFNQRLHSQFLNTQLTKARWWLAGAAVANWLYLLLNDSLK